MHVLPCPAPTREHPDDNPLMCTAPLFVARKRAAAEGYTLIEGSCFAASPAGTVNQADYEFMRDQVLGQLPEQQQVQRFQEGLLVVDQVLDQSQQPNRQYQFPTVGSLIQVGNVVLVCQS